MPSPDLRIPWFVWWSLIRELKHRSGGRRESGAFLLGRSGTRQVTHFICYDDLDPTALDTGIIVFHGEGFVPLWEFCRTRKKRVFADVHTHATEWTGQSNSDRTHPMIAQSGHVALRTELQASHDPADLLRCRAAHLRSRTPESR
jgi:hypothetical protein